MAYDKWVIDSTFYKDDGLLCFVPIEHPHTPQETLVLGMNVLSDIEHFALGRVIGIVHLDGDAACDAFCATHPDIVQALQAKLETT